MEELEQIMRRIHVLFAKCEPYGNESDGRIIVPKKELFRLLEKLNYAVIRMMDEYEGTAESRERGMVAYQREGERIKAAAQAGADDVYAASLIYTDNMLEELHDVVADAKEELWEQYARMAGRLDSHARLLSEDQEEIKRLLTAMAQGGKYLKIIEHENKRLQKIEAQRARAGEEEYGAESEEYWDAYGEDEEWDEEDERFEENEDAQGFAAEAGIDGEDGDAQEDAAKGNGVYGKVSDADGLGEAAEDADEISGLEQDAAGMDESGYGFFVEGVHEVGAGGGNQEDAKKDAVTGENPDVDATLEGLGAEVDAILREEGKPLETGKAGGTVSASGAKTGKTGGTVSASGAKTGKAGGTASASGKNPQKTAGKQNSKYTYKHKRPASQHARMVPDLEAEWAKEEQRPVRKIGTAIYEDVGQPYDEPVKRVSYEVKVNQAYFDQLGEGNIDLDAEYYQWKEEQEQAAAASEEEGGMSGEGALDAGGKPEKNKKAGSGKKEKKKRGLKFGKRS